MAITKNPLIRYKVLDKCFRNPGRKYFINDLISEVNKLLEEIDSESKGISRRQILEDIKFMESSEGWNIDLKRIREGKRIYFRYEDFSYSINNMPLNEIEINHLQSAVDILSQFKGMPQFEWINELVPKLKQGMAIEKSSHTIIEFDNNQYLKGIELLGPLHNAILYKKVLKINYQPFEDERSSDIVLHPYYLKQYNNRWFLFGYNPEREKYDWNLALDRILNIEELKDKYQKNNKIDWDYYFEDIIGVTKSENQKLENIVLNFFGKTGRYIVSKPIHGSQKSRWIDSNTLEVKFHLIINYEFERMILSYADSVKVIEPITLANLLKSRLKQAYNQY